MSHPEIFDLCKNGDAAKVIDLLNRDGEQLNAVNRVIHQFI